MTVDVTVGPDLMCGGCGDRVNEINTESRRGPCCHNLPAPWTRGRNGLYTSNTEYRPPGAPDPLDPGEEAEEATPHCRECGSTSFVVRAELTVEGESGDGQTLYLDWCDLEINRVTCSRCDTRARHIHVDSC